MKTLLFILLAMMPGCRPCEPQTFDMGEIPQEVLDQVPYTDGDILEMIHSAGRVIRFSIDRIVEDKEEILCSDCCDTYLFEEARIGLHPDHPVFDCQMRLNNMDTLMYFLNISIERAFYQVPVADSMWTYFDVADSMQIGSSIYHDVFRLNNQYDFREADASGETIGIDSLFFNFTEGILKITMTNDEYYCLVE